MATTKPTNPAPKEAIAQKPLIANKYCVAAMATPAPITNGKARVTPRQPAYKCVIQTPHSNAMMPNSSADSDCN